MSDENKKDYAKQIVGISKEEIRTILHSSKSLLLNCTDMGEKTKFAYGS